MATVQIKIAGTDRASAILFATAYFQSQVNGVSGEARFRIRDPDRTLTILPGALVELIIDGDPVWTGFVSAPKRVYVFPAINIDDFGETRFLDISCVDLNVLFQRRIAFNQIDPENVLAPIYGPNTADTVAIADLVADWLDLSGDGIDTSTFVTGVGDINEDQDARAWSGSDTWGQAMGSIALLPAAIYYLSPSKDLVYCDTDTPTAPFGLSDQPNGSTYLGYREMEILLDGANLANDVMCWGIGYGSNAPVFVRDEDATSQAAHGLWQLGQVTFGIYKQATINRVADSILNGSPDNRRGAKDDRPAVMVTTYEPGLLPSQKVDFVSNVFGWSDVLPIRKMEVTFEAPDTPKYALTLSHEIDTPWSFYDPWRLSLPRLPSLPPFPPWPPLPGPEVPGGCTPALCGITDMFTRTLGSSWGTSDSGLVWSDSFTGPGPSVSGGTGIITADLNDGALMTLPGGPPGSFTLRSRFKFMTPAGIPGTGDRIACSLDLGGDKYVFLGISTDSTLGSVELGGGAGYVDVVKTNWDDNSFYDLILNWDETTGDLKLKLWNVGAEPSTWLLETVQTDPLGGYFDFGFENNAGAAGEYSVHVEQFDIEGVNRCTEYRFDNFDRTVSGGWGNASSGPTWIVTGAGSADVFGTEASLAPDTGGGVLVAEVTGPITSGMDFTCTIQFFVFSGIVSANFIFGGLDFGWHRSATYPTNEQQDYLYLWDGAGAQLSAFVGTGTEDIWHSSPMDVSTWGFLKVDRFGQHVRAKLWGDAGAEPGWMLEGDLEDFTVLTQDQVAATNDSGTGVGYGYIDFDYDGKPCYEECAEGGGPLVEEDTFARTISAGSTDLGTSEFTGNPPWVADGTPRPNLSASGGIVTMTAAASPNHRNIQDVVDIDLRLPIDIVFRARSRPASGAGSVVISIEEPPLDGSNYVTIIMATDTADPDGRFVFVGAGDGATDYGVTSNFNVIADNTWYTIRATFRSDSVRAKWWADGDPEPDTWTITAGIVGNIISALDLNNTLELRMTQTSDIDGIAFYETGCQDVPPEPASPGGPMYGPRCDLAVRIDSTHYQLAMSVSPGTTNVTVGTPGYLYLPGIARDYTCSDEDGILTFADAIADGTRVYVCYQAAGPI